MTLLITSLIAGWVLFSVVAAVFVCMLSSRLSQREEARPLRYGVDPGFDTLPPRPRPLPMHTEAGALKAHARH